MLEEIAFSVDGTPVPQSRPRMMRLKNGNMIAVSNPKHSPIATWKAQVAYAACEANTDGDLLTGPLQFEVTFHFQRPLAKRWTRKAMHSYYHSVRPDLDNLVKAVLDALTDVLWRDDSQIAVMIMRKHVRDAKFHNEQHLEQPPGTSIVVKRLPQDD